MKPTNSTTTIVATVSKPALAALPVFTFFAFLTFYWDVDGSGVRGGLFFSTCALLATLPLFNLKGENAKGIQTTAFVLTFLTTVAVTTVFAILTKKHETAFLPAFTQFFLWVPFILACVFCMLIFYYAYFKKQDFVFEFTPKEINTDGTGYHLE